MVERRGVNRRLLLGIERLHQIDLDLVWALADGADVFVNVLTLGDEVAGDLQAQHIDPELAQGLLVGAADGDLLDAENLVGFHVWYIAVGVAELDWLGWGTRK